MDIDSFIDELEKVCDCPNQGYMKCLEKVKQLKNKTLMARDLCKGVVKLQEQIKTLKEENDRLEKSRDAMCKVVVELQEQIKTLKEENDRLERWHEWNKIAAIKLGEAREEIEKLRKGNETYEDLLAGKDGIIDENKKLKAELEEMGTEYDPRVDKLVDKEWLEKLKEENEKLKQFAMKVHNFAFCTKYDDEDIVSSFDLDAILEEMKKDEDKLYEGITSLKKHFNIIIDLIKGCDTDEKLQKLKELNTLDKSIP